jgi:hypothetical protein
MDCLWGTNEAKAEEKAVPDVGSRKACRGKRFRAEVNPCQSWFHVQDPVNQRVLDVPASFAPASCKTFLWKVLYSGTCIGTMIWAMIASTPYFYFAYLTNWGVLWCTLYSAMSVLNSVMATHTPQPAEDKSVGLRIRLTWILFTLGSHGSAAATLLFWPLIYDPATTNVTYLTVAPHGVLLILTCFDGFYVNRIPLRWMHYCGIVLPMNICYLLWSVIHDRLDIGNPNNSDNDPTTNDDAIYPNVLEWNYDWQKALLWSVLSIVVVGPVIFSILWNISLGFCSKDTRKYVPTEQPKEDVEEGIFAMWLK